MIDPKLKSFVIATLRRSSYRWSSRTEALKRARISRGLYKCESCSSEVKKKEIQLDHISPVIPLTGWISWDNFIERLFCDASGYQTICIACHSAKTSIESALRAVNRKKSKKLTKDKE